MGLSLWFDVSLCFSIGRPSEDEKYDDDDDKRKEEKGLMSLDSCFWERELSVKSWGLLPYLIRWALLRL